MPKLSGVSWIFRIRAGECECEAFAACRRAKSAAAARQVGSEAKMLVRLVAVGADC